MFQSTWSENLFYVSVYGEDRQETDIYTCSLYVVDIGVIVNNRKY